MVSLLIAFAVLIAGYLVYSRVAEKIFAADEGFRIPTKIAYPIGLGFAAALLIVYAVLLCRKLCGSRRTE